MSLVTLVLALPLLFATPSAEDVQHALGQVFETGRYQDTRPTPPPIQAERMQGDGTGQGAGWQRGGGREGDIQREDGRAPPDTGSLEGLGPLAGLIELLLWTGVAIAGFLAILAFARNLSARRQRPPPLLPPEPSPPDAPPPIEQPLDEATALAAQGRYAEAAHVLLLKTLEILAEEDHLPPSWTSREAATRLKLEAASEEALGQLVEVTEVSLFGGRAVDAQAYQACVRAHRALRTALAG